MGMRHIHRLYTNPRKFPAIRQANTLYSKETCLRWCSLGLFAKIPLAWAHVPSRTIRAESSLDPIGSPGTCFKSTAVEKVCDIMSSDNV